MRAHRRKLIVGLVVLAGIVGLVIGAMFLHNRRLPLEDIARVERRGGTVTMQPIVSSRVPMPSNMRSMDLPFVSRRVADVSFDWTSIGDADLEILTPLDPHVLSLRNTHITDDGLKRLASFQNLHCIRLDGTEITDKGLANLKQLPRLSMLSLSNTQITDAGVKELASFPRLSLIHLDETPVTDACLDHLQGLASLHWLTLYQTSVSKEAVEKFSAARPNVRVEYRMPGQR